MVYSLIITWCCIFLTTQSIYSMDLPPLPKKKQKRLSARPQSPRRNPSPEPQSHLSDSDSSAPPKQPSSKTSSPARRIIASIAGQRKGSPTPPTSQAIDFISAVKENDLTIIKSYINNPTKNPNQQDQWKNTALHFAVMFRNIDIINLLLSDPRLNSALTNDRNKTAHELIARDETTLEMRHLLFARIQLDRIVDKEAFIMFMDSGKTSNDIIDTIDNIKAKIHETEKNQPADRALPTEALLPKYATDDFIKQMILAHNERSQLMTTELYAAKGPLSHFNPYPTDTPNDITITPIRSLLTIIMFNDEPKPFHEWILHKEFLEETSLVVRSPHDELHVKVDNLLKINLQQLVHIIKGPSYFYSKPASINILYELEKFDKALQNTQPPVIFLKKQSFLDLGEKK